MGALHWVPALTVSLSHCRQGGSWALRRPLPIQSMYLNVLRRLVSKWTKRTNDGAKAKRPACSCNLRTEALGWRSGCMVGAFCPYSPFGRQAGSWTGKQNAAPRPLSDRKTKKAKRRKFSFSCLALSCVWAPAGKFSLSLVAQERAERRERRVSPSVSTMMSERNPGQARRPPSLQPFCFSPKIGAFPTRQTQRRKGSAAGRQVRTLSLSRAETLGIRQTRSRSAASCDSHLFRVCVCKERRRVVRASADLRRT